MAVQQTSYVYLGDTFFGEFDVAQAGPTQMVRVRYRGDELRSRVSGRPAEAVAQTLLRELVSLEAIAAKTIVLSAQRRAVAG